MQLTDSLQDIHPDKLQSVISTHLQNGRTDAVRQALPELIAQHPTLAEELSKTLQQLRGNTAHQPVTPTPFVPGSQPNNLKLEEDTAAKSTIELISGRNANIFSCANCGGTVSRQSSESVQVICHYCGCDSQHPPANGLSQWAEKLHTNSRFSIGSRIFLQNAEWQAIGVQRYSGEIREWDSEDNDWETNRADYTLWWMINEKREIAWLSDYGKKRYWSEKYTPINPSLPEKNNKSIEYGKWALQFAAGEFSYQPKPGEQRTSAEYSKAPDTEEPAKNSLGQHYAFSVDAAANSLGEATEYEFIRSVAISHNDILSGLGDTASIAVVARWKNTAWVFLATTLLVGASFLLIRYTHPSQPLWQKTVSLQAAIEAQVGQIRVEEAGTVVQIIARLENTIPAQRYLELDIDVFNAADELSGGYFVEFWHETGSDDDGPWDESRYRFSNALRFDETGIFDLVAAAGETNTTLPVNVHVQAISNPVLTPSFIVSAIVAAFLGILSLFRSRSKASSGASISAQMSRVKRLDNTAA